MRGHARALNPDITTLIMRIQGCKSQRQFASNTSPVKIPIDRRTLQAIAKENTLKETIAPTAPSGQLDSCTSKSDVDSPHLSTSTSWCNDADSSTDEQSSTASANQGSIDSQCTSALDYLNKLELQALQAHAADYRDAFQIEQQRKILAARASYLQEKLGEQLHDAARKIAPRFYGWQPSDWNGVHGQLIKDDRDPDDLWRALRAAEAHSYPLEDPAVSDRFFKEMEELMLVEDLAELQCGTWADETTSYETNSRMSPSSRKQIERKPNPVVRTTNQRHAHSKPKLSVPVSSIPRGKTTSQKRLEQELAKKEAALQAMMKDGFRANPVPASTLIPRYDQIMRSRGTKSAAMRAQRVSKIKGGVKPFGFSSKPNDKSCPCGLEATVENALNQISRDAHSKPIIKSQRPAGSPPPRLVQQAIEDGRRRRQRILENESKAGLTEEHKFRPKINWEIPNHARNHAKFAKEVEKRKTVHSPTKPHPFPGVEYHHQVAPSRSRHQQCALNNDAVSSSRHQWPYIKKKRLSIATRMQIPKARETHSHRLKVLHRKTVEETRGLIKDELEKQRQERRKEIKRIEQKVRSRLTTKIGTTANSDSVHHARQEGYLRGTLVRKNPLAVCS
ncbi:uncharacterized protein SPPG_08600 [Spizellomyces punctatus DAOM BR117]|uniref:Uncharacterized protein n=1 Tax=Spizellomyces punctatus (strain DAOM BR117) TaxID=645134 RepID=A0A0L0H506_SPIPD|nr:uncharacterized protein SPPG_08600 [Spizellomyces punctatus DAOM BR117]KNC96001.1 hypothetical protein SPPG_08600 [Spizellomyces punctatus DAOM BR117]|eukprot:XP_016604041.1 hypothetical protein SPPG_08600 [Spizellomyces punctatus DAOM BR117]